jgi:hypothetical protein
MDGSRKALVIRVMEHWEKCLPKRTRELKDAGQFDKTTQIVAVYAQAEIAELMAQGCPEHAAEEVVLSLYAMLEPELQENAGKGSRLGWNEPLSVYLPPTLGATPGCRR